MALPDEALAPDWAFPANPVGPPPKPSNLLEIANWHVQVARASHRVNLTREITQSLADITRIINALGGRRHVRSPLN